MTTFLHYQDDSLRFGEKSIRLEEVAAGVDGPVYVYDLALAEDRLERMQKALAPGRLYYAMKANNHPELLRRLKAKGAGADVVSGGEIQRALDCGFQPEDIVFSGVGKTDREITLALRRRIRQLNVESVPELIRIAEIAASLNERAPVALRLNPDVDIKTHPYIATGLAENKFGMELGMLPDITAVLDQHRASLEPVGVSLHLGSQMREFSGLDEALRRLVPVYLDLRRRYATVHRFDAGGGLGIRYEEDRPDLEQGDLASYAAAIEKNLATVPGEIQFEPGRWIVGHAGVLLTRVLYVKTTSHRTFLVVDSGMNHLLRPALYGAHHRILPLRRTAERPVRKVDVVGPICESSDVFAKNLEMPEVKAGEWLVIADAGAYGFTMANTYNLQDLPREIPL